jgi:uncharacterized protein (DUF427 family)
MIRATWNGVMIAESNDTVVVEGNHYFPAAAVRADVLQPSARTSVCSWKGTASYHSLLVNGQINQDAAWVYPTPHAAAMAIAGRIAFWRGVTVENDAAN